MKQATLFTILFFIATLGISHAAIFEWHSGYFSGETYSYAENGAGESVASGPYYDTGPQYVEVASYAEVNSVIGESLGGGNSFQDMDFPNEMLFGATANTTVWSEDPAGRGTGYGKGQSLQFVQIIPEAGEHMGDPITLGHYWYGEVWMEGGTASITGNDSTGNYFGITSGTDWLWMEETITDEGIYDHEGSNIVHIGDIIGVHLGTTADINISGIIEGGFSDADSEIWLIVPKAPPVPIPGAVWLLGSGLLCVGLIRRRTKTDE